MAGKIWRTTPPSRPDTRAANLRFNVRKCSHARLNLFHSVPDITLPGTLHHSGNRPAPPSEDTPLERRIAFQQHIREFGQAARG
jgi:hypothetical protein